MFRVWLTNFGWYANQGQPFATLKQAKLEAQRVGFDSCIIGPNGPVMGYSILGGFNNLTSQEEEVPCQEM